ncbi:hypothetical protein ACG873_24965 [Mesorhizobium sp. AaZ16]|uniref:CRISPR-associated endonuclease Cas2 n=1 Tax=Mesorhizobium sp. AaZ16 TaxID=3402289 RepID=UPI00374FBA4E
MAVYIVTYDLNAPKKDYAPLLAAVRKYIHCYALKSAFFIDTVETEMTVATKLMKLVDANDSLYVMEISQRWAANRKMACTEWLTSAARSWGKKS